MNIDQINNLKQPGLLFIAVSLGLFIFRMALPFMLPLSILMFLISLSFMLINESELFHTNKRKMGKIILDLKWMLLLLLPFFWAIVNTEFSFYPVLAKEGFNFLYIFALILTALLLNKNNESKDFFLTYVCWVFFILGVMSACLGITKLFHWMYGFKWTLLFDDYAYPAGTSMSGDYNFYSLSCIIAIFAGAYLFQLQKIKHSYFVWVFFLTLAICLSGSRRSLLLYPIFAFFPMIITLKSASRIQRIQRFLLSILTMFIAPIGISLYFFVLTPVQKNEMAKTLKMKTRVVKTEMSKLSFRYLTIIDPKANYREFYKLNWYVKEGTQTTLPGYTVPDEEKTTYGSRIERWKYAAEVFSNQYNFSQKMTGNGFGYMRNYAKRFNLLWKTPYDYPHNPVLSALLYGGLVGVIFMLLYMGRWAFLLYKNRSDLSFIFLVSIACLVYGLSSGNTLFSIPVVVFLLIFPFYFNVANAE